MQPMLTKTQRQALAEMDKHGAGAVHVGAPHGWAFRVDVREQPGVADRVLLRLTRLNCEHNRTLDCSS